MWVRKRDLVRVRVRVRVRVKVRVTVRIRVRVRYQLGALVDEGGAVDSPLVILPNRHYLYYPISGWSLG